MIGHAELHYWLWRVGRAETEDRGPEDEEEHRIEALRLYELLLAKTPKYKYREADRRSDCWCFQ